MLPPSAILPDGTVLIKRFIIPPAGSSFDGGIAIEPDTGAMYTTGALGDTAVNGHLLVHNGRLCVSVDGGGIDRYAMGLPFTDEGRLVCQEDTPGAIGDSMVGGVRVGPLGGVYITQTVPDPYESFDDGFDGGFD